MSVELNELRTTDDRVCQSARTSSMSNDPDYTRATTGSLALTPTSTLALVAAVISAVGTLLPWASAQVFFAEASVSGIEQTDGVICLIAAAAAGFFALFMANGRTIPALAVLIGGAIAGGVAGYDIGHYYDVVADDEFARSVSSLQIGIFMTAGGGLVAGVSGLVNLFTPEN